MSISDYLGRRCKLKPVKEVDFGYYLGTEDDKVLLPKGEAPKDMGEEIEVFIYKDSEDRLIATTIMPDIEIGQLARLEVASSTGIGAFLSWGLKKELLLPFKEQTKKVKEGDIVLVALYIDKSSRLCATMKLYPYLEADASYCKDDEVNGYVYEISERFGTFVAIDDKYQGLIPAKEGVTHLKVGDDISARVSAVHEDGKIDLSVRKKAFLQMDDDSAVILTRLKEYDGVLPFTDKANPEVIKTEFGFSKNAFKRAVGRLLKEGKIRITENTIELL